MTLPSSTVLASIPALDVDALFERLPALVRARVEWTRRPIEDGLARLRTLPLTDGLVAETADEMQGPILEIGLASWETVTGSRDEARAVLMDEFWRDERDLSGFLPDDDARDTLRWVIGLLRSLANLFFTLIASAPAGTNERVGAEDVARAATQPEAKPFIRGLVALMAAVRVARSGGDPIRAVELVDVSFLELRDLRNILRQQGVSLSAFPDETVEERHRRLIVSAARLRKSLSDDDWCVLDAARVRDLR